VRHRCCNMLQVAAVFCGGLLLGVVGGFFLCRYLSSAAGSSGSGAGAGTPEAMAGEMKMVLLVRNDLGMQKGKIAAQCGHAVLGAYHAALRQRSPFLDTWEASGAKKIALKVSSEEELCELGRRARKRDLVSYMVRDAGHTQVAPNTRTVCAIGPAPVEALDALGCKDLKLL
ncbi:unnamed protein product, partial [Polarella glacialis]